MSTADDQRYSRQTLFPAIGKQGQAAIRQSCVVLVGCGALGSHLAECMVRAGVGELHLIDRDFVEASNLQRQALYTEEHAQNAAPKAQAAADVLRTYNSDVKIIPHVSDLTPENAEDLLEDADLILDATDNFESRLLINDYAIKNGLPWIYCACVAARAMCMPVLPGESACLACLLDDLPLGGETCDTTGIIMPAVLAAVGMAAAEALKLLAGDRDAVIRELRLKDLWSGKEQSLAMGKPVAGCRCCDAREFAYLSGRKASAAIKLCGRNSVQLISRDQRALSLADLAERLRASAPLLAQNEFLVRFAHRDLEITVFADGRTLVSGTTDPAHARAAVAQLLGA